MHYIALSISAPKFTASFYVPQHSRYLPVDMPVFVKVIESLQGLLQDGGDGDLVEPIRIGRFHDVKT